MNGYFQIVQNAQKIVIRVYPATDGGDPVRRDELVEYLSLKNIFLDILSLV